MKTIKPIFLLSLPRSGSTLLQSMLASRQDEAISSLSEPWIALPVVSSLSKKANIIATYDQSLALHAVDDFVQSLPDGILSLRKAIACFLSTLYSQAASQEAVYFLDKTPQYCLIAKDLVTLFPDARFIVLWRNPLASIASQLQLWRQGKFELTPEFGVLDALESENTRGLGNLHEIVETNSKSILQVRYEELVKEPHRIMQTIFDFLQLPSDPTVCTTFTEFVFRGHHQDPLWGKKYRSLSTGSLDEWIDVFRSPIRRAWAKRYLDRIGDERLTRMGYSKIDLLAQIPSGKWYRIPKDLFFMLRAAARGRVRHGLTNYLLR